MSFHHLAIHPVKTYQKNTNLGHIDQYLHNRHQQDLVPIYLLNYNQRTIDYHQILGHHKGLNHLEMRFLNSNDHR